MRLISLRIFVLWFQILAICSGEIIWIEGESPTVNQMNRHPWWYDKVKRQELSGNDFISNFNKEKPGIAEYRFNANDGGEYNFWIRGNPVQAELIYSLNSGAEKKVDFSKTYDQPINIAEDGKIDLRFIAWINAGKVTLNKGTNAIIFKMTSANYNHGMIDCFVFANAPFYPEGKNKQGKNIDEIQRDMVNWVEFAPPEDTFEKSPIDLRFLNETVAGENGFIGVKDGQFVHTGNGKPVRFWAVNGPPGNLKREELRRAAMMLAKRGVNLVRVHGAVFDKNCEPNFQKVKYIQAVVQEMKSEGIYTHLSIYFPLWFTPGENLQWLAGYDGKKHPFATLFFNPQFQNKYMQWWKALLLTPDEKTGRKLIDEPAVFGVEIQNEDSLFFWTFSENNIPDAQLKILEKEFGDWVLKQYGSFDAVFQRWKGLKIKRDNPQEGRIGFRPLWNIFTDKTIRDQDTVRFMAEVQIKFYKRMYQFLRSLGFKGVITASNWTTANQEILGPIEILTYSTCDFIDRHGYFSCSHKGEFSEWSIRNTHTYLDRSALRFDGDKPGSPKQFLNPVMDIEYDNKPTMLSETTFNRPNRYRTEAPLYFAVYGALQDSDAIVHFALDGINWSVKPNFFMQPWTLMSPTMMGQFPASALIYRLSLIKPTEPVVELTLNTNDLLQLKGTPLPQGASFDELRLKDVPTAAELITGKRIDPLVHYVGKTVVNFSSAPTTAKISPLNQYIDHTRKIVVSKSGDLKLDYAKGILFINSPYAQGICGNLKEAGKTQLSSVEINSDMNPGAIIIVSLDNRPIAASEKILLQVMSEEKPSEFITTKLDTGFFQINNIGRDPWLIRKISGTVSIKRKDVSKLKAVALDHNGYPAGTSLAADQIKLLPSTIYYFIGN